MKRLISVLLALMLVLTLGACSSSTSSDDSSSDNTSDNTSDETETVSSGVEDGVLTIAMECAYAPYNWTQTDDSNGAVPIKDSSDYANGYDVMVAQMICEENGWDLEIVRLDWDSLVPAVQSGIVDAVIAGQSMTAERSEQVDFAGPYYYASFAILVPSDSPLASATSIHDFTGYSGTAQLGTIWYDQCLPQMDGVNILTASESAPAMLMAVESGAADFVVTDLPTATGAVAAYDDLKILDFTGTDGDFVFTDEEREGNVNIGISVMKGNTVLKDAINSALTDFDTTAMNALMDAAISIQPVGE